MKKLVAEKLLIIALAGIRRMCEQEGLNFKELVVKSTNNKMTLEHIEQAIDAFDETGNQDDPEDFLKYLERESGKGGGFS